MVETVGRRLRKQRLAQRLEIDEVSESTKIRPDQLIGLESDDYSRFANLAYARSFLAKYAQFLGEDISEELEHFQVSREISLGDYQYLRTEPPRREFVASRAPSRGFRVPPWLVLALVTLLLVGIPTFSYLALNIPRLRRTKHLVAVPLPAAEVPLQVGASAAPPPRVVEIPKPITPNPAPTAVPRVSAVAAAPAASPSATVEPRPSAIIPAEEQVAMEVRRALPLDASEIADNPGAPPGIDLPGAEKTLEVKALKRTWVTVTKDQAGSQPVFSGYTGPEKRPIRVEGRRFWLKVHDKRAVEVREDGQLVLGNSDDIVID